MRTDRRTDGQTDEGNSRFFATLWTRLKTRDTGILQKETTWKEWRNTSDADIMLCTVVLPRVYAAFTFVQRCEPLMPNLLPNNRGFHMEPLAGRIHRHPVACLMNDRNNHSHIIRQLRLIIGRCDVMYRHVHCLELCIIWITNIGSAVTQLNTLLCVTTYLHVSV